MLGKLIKYDLNYIARKMFPFLLFALISSVVLTIANVIQRQFQINAVLPSLMILFGFTTIISLVGLTIVSVIMPAYRFYTNVLKDEGYLTNTLPISKTNLVLSKLLAGMITVAITYIIISIITFLLFRVNIDGYTLNHVITYQIYGNFSFTKIMVLIFLVFVTQMTSFIAFIIAALSVGHSYDNNKLVKSVLFGIIFYVAMQILAGIVVAIIIWAPNHGYDSMMFDGQGAISLILYLSMFVNLIFISVFFFISKKFIGNKLNLE